MRLAPLTTLRLGGPAQGLIEAHTEDELIEAVRGQRPALLLAGGSNVVIADDGVPGTVVLVRTRGVAARRRPAGRPGRRALGRAGRALRRRGPAGLRVPVRDPRLDRRDADPERRRLRAGRGRDRGLGARLRPRGRRGDARWTRAECGFEYRRSVFKHRDRWTVLAVAFRTDASPSSPGRCATPSWRGRSASRSAAARRSTEVRAAVLGLRRGKGMVIDPDDPDSVSAGSFFTNPILTHEAWSRLPDAPAFPEPDGRIKTSAAWLIERAGFTKGYGDGAAGISSKHTLALINRGEATTASCWRSRARSPTACAPAFGVEYWCRNPYWWGRLGEVRPRMVLLALAALMLPASAASADGGWNADLVGAERPAPSCWSPARRPRAGSSSRTSTRTAGRGSGATTPSGPVRLGTQNAQDRLQRLPPRLVAAVQPPDPARSGGGAAQRASGASRSSPRRLRSQQETPIAETFAPVAETLFWMRDELATITYIVRPKRRARAGDRERRPPSATLGAPLTVSAAASATTCASSASTSRSDRLSRPVSVAAAPWRGPGPDRRARRPASTHSS